MTRGHVEELQARVGVAIRRPDVPDLVIEFVIDTGFAGALTLPPAAVTALSLPFLQELSASLADDSSVRADVHVATVVWDGRDVEVMVLAMGRRPLLGTAWLAGNSLSAQFVENGNVEIDEL